MSRAQRRKTGWETSPKVFGFPLPARLLGWPYRVAGSSWAAIFITDGLTGKNRDPDTWQHIVAGVAADGFAFCPHTVA